MSFSDGYGGYRKKVDKKYAAALKEQKEKAKEKVERKELLAEKKKTLIEQGKMFTLVVDNPNIKRKVRT